MRNSHNFVILLFALTFVVPPVHATDLFDGAPAAPPGYETHTAAQAAVISGKVPAVTQREEVPDSIAFHDDLVFAKPGGKALSLDLFVPKEASNPPLLVFIHGGGWRGGKKEDLALYTIGFAESGYATASIQYRLSPEFKFPAAIQDVHCALGWLQEQASSYGFDGTRMVLLGGSAGGHLALLAGYNNDDELECPDGANIEPGTVKGIVNLYGVVDCTTPIAQAAYQVQDFIGKSYDEAAETYAQASPMLHLDAGDPPTLTFHGTIDELVPIAQADRLHEKLDELDIVNYYDRVEGWPHSMDLAKPVNDRCQYVIRRFLEIHLPLEP